MSYPCPRAAAKPLRPEPPSSSPLTRDSDLPGPRTPVVLQSLQWLVKPPLRWTFELSQRYGDTFRLRVLGPSHAQDQIRRTLIPCTVVVVSKPSDHREVFARSRTELQAGEASKFIRWHAGDDSVVVLDGAAHREERNVLQDAMRVALLPTYEQLTRAALIRAFADWPDRGTVSLRKLVRRAGLDAALTSMFGPLDPAILRHLGSLVDAGAATTALAPPLMLLPMLQRDLGRWSPGGRVRRARARFDGFVAQALAEGRADSGGSAIGSILDALKESGRCRHGQRETPATVIQRVRTMVSALRTAAIAAVWLCYHVLRDSDARVRVLEAAFDADAENSERYLEAACQESLRLNPPFIGGLRRVAAPLNFGGIAWQTGTLVLPHSPLTHRRAELYPEPDRFRPERFLERSFAPEEYAPFGGGIRRCLGEQFALRQMRILLVELFRTFELEPLRVWSRAERRCDTMILPRDPLLTTLRRRSASPGLGPTR